MDLLARYDAPAPSEGIDIGEGLVARRERRPRARRVPNRPAKAYDAREIYLSDKADGPPSLWRLASVLTGLIELIQEPPPVDAAQARVRLEQIKELIRCAESRGLDLNSHLLFHLRFYTASAVFHQLVAHRERESGPFAGSDLRGWLTLADEHLSRTSSTGSVASLSSAYLELSTAVNSWALDAQKDDLLGWIGPAVPVVEQSTTAATRTLRGWRLHLRSPVTPRAATAVGTVNRRRTARPAALEGARIGSEQRICYSPGEPVCAGGERRSMPDRCLSGGADHLSAHALRRVLLLGAQPGTHLQVAEPDLAAAGRFDGPGVDEAAPVGLRVVGRPLDAPRDAVGL